MFSPENLTNEIPTKYFLCFTETEARGSQNESSSNRFVGLKSGLESLYLDHPGWVRISLLIHFFFLTKYFIYREKYREKYKGPSVAATQLKK